MLGFQCLNEFAGVGKKLSSGYREFLSQSVRNLTDGTPLLQQLPDSKSDWVEAETNALFNIQEHGPIFGSSFPDAWCDREVCDLCRLAHIAALRQSRSVLSGVAGHNSLGFWTPPKLFLLQESVQGGTWDKMISMAF
jgi:hypothetical protein